MVTLLFVVVVVGRLDEVVKVVVVLTDETLGKGQTHLPGTGGHIAGLAPQ